MKTIIEKTPIFFLVLGFILSFYGCEDNSSVEPEKSIVEVRGDIYSTTHLSQYTSDNLKSLFTGAGISVPFEPAYSVNVIKIVYLSKDQFGNNTKASGTIMIPIDAENLPIFSLQHGTVNKRDNITSSGNLNSAEGFSGLLTASIGYVICIPDYLGFGESDVMHPYLHARSLSICIIDFIRASKKYCEANSITLNEQLFLGGYSEGGYTTLATQKEIESNYYDEFQLTAVAPAAGPYDLIGTTNIIFQQENYSRPSHLAFILTAYNNIYNWNRLNEIFKVPYSGMMAGLFDGTKSSSEINHQLPTKISELLNQNFIDNYLNGTDSSFISALQENTLLNWKPIAPIRFYHGNADDVSPYQNSLTALENLKANGAANIELITIEGGDHGSSGVPAVMGIIEWFNSFKGNNVLAKK